MNYKQACDSLVYNDNHIINALFTTTSQEQEPKVSYSDLLRANPVQ